MNNINRTKTSFEQINHQLESVAINPHKTIAEYNTLNFEPGLYPIKTGDVLKNCIIESYNDYGYTVIAEINQTLRTDVTTKIAQIPFNVLSNSDDRFKVGQKITVEVIDVSKKPTSKFVSIIVKPYKPSEIEDIERTKKRAEQIIACIKSEEKKNPNKSYKEFVPDILNRWTVNFDIKPMAMYCTDCVDIFFENIKDGFTVSKKDFLY